MAITTDYRDGTASATQLMQQAFEDAGSVDKGHGKALEWHEGLPTYEESNAQRKEQAAKPIEWAVDKAMDALAEGMGKAVAEKIFGKEIVQIAETAMKPGETVAKEVAKKIILGLSADAMVGLAMAAGGVVTIAAAIKNIADGDRSRDQQDTIGLDLATTRLLTLDGDYKHSVFVKYDGNCEPESVMRLFRAPDGSLTAYGREALPKLQAACDAGSRAGFDAVRSGNLAGFLAAHPAIAARREKDVAFAKGFDQVLFAARCGDGGHKLVAIQKDIDARDARMTAQVPVRG